MLYLVFMMITIYMSYHYVELKNKYINLLEKYNELKGEDK